MSAAIPIITAVFLQDQYVGNQLSISEISEKYGISSDRLYKAMKRLDIPRRNRGQAGVVAHLHGRLIAPQGGKIAKQRGTQNYKTGDKHCRWRGGRRKTGEGYIYVYMPNHPFAKDGKYMLEHRLIMEKIIGRYLEKDEIVHHKNGIKDDNHPGNLILMKKIKHNKENGYAAAYQDGFSAGQQSVHSFVSYH